MLEVAILGAGELGGAVAHRLAKSNAVAAIRLLDESGSVAAGKALDIAQASAVERFSTRVSASSDLNSASASPIVVVADRVSAGEWLDEDSLALLRRLCAINSPILICAGANQRDTIERGVRELRLSRARILGSAPEALAAAVRAMAALETGTSPLDIHVPVLGVPPRHVVVPWESPALRGSGARSMTLPMRRRIEARIPALWPPGPQALAAAAVKTVEAIVGRSRQLVSIFVGPDDSAGRRTRAAAFPARLGPDGMTAIELPDLTPHESTALDSATLL